jgi:hypothetical protein
MGFVDSNMTNKAIGEIVMNDFINKPNIKKENQGENTYTNIYIIEEIQNVLGSYAMTGDIGRFWLKMASECANYGQVMIGIGQRLGDISAKFVERTKYFMFGSLSGDNDLKKIQRMAGEDGDKLGDAITQLKFGEFLFWDKVGKTADVIGFPKFEQNEKPYQYVNGVNGHGYVKRIFLGAR